MAIYDQVHSEYELRELAVKVNGSEAFKHADCVGSAEEELDVVQITKKCRGVTAKTRVKGAGTGTVTISAHVPYDLYNAIYDMSERADLVEGVEGYGNANVHKEFAMVERVFDEDGIEKLKAYPRCIMLSGPKSSIENGAEEVAELELEVSLMPDANGYCMYQCIVDTLPEGSEIQSKWMTEFTPDLVQKVVPK